MKEIDIEGYQTGGFGGRSATAGSFYILENGLYGGNRHSGGEDGHTVVVVGYGTIRTNGGTDYHRAPADIVEQAGKGLEGFIHIDGGTVVAA